jgi:redox-sensitive bicupin YhaK (pirin superfamily)
MGSVPAERVHSGSMSTLAAGTPLVLPEPPNRTADELSVRRVLPTRPKRNVGPFVFFDHFGPADVAEGGGVNVRPHPHIGLSTVTYLFEGAILHRDSLGTEQVITPGDLNWMTAGRGIVHSERMPLEPRQRSRRIHGLQIWVALPLANEECEPAFQHCPGHALPAWSESGVHLRLLAGTALGRASPAITSIDLHYLEVRAEAGSEWPTLGAPHHERAIYGLSGLLSVAGTPVPPGRLAILPEDRSTVVRVEEPGTWVTFGGAPLDAPRYLDWNFVSSSRERLEQAKADWRAGRFPKVPGDEQEFIPLPE